MSDDEAEVLELPPQTASADRQERQIRELLGQCYMVGLEKQCSLDGPSRWIAEYRKQPREGRVRLKPNFDKLKPVSVEMNHSVECIDDGISRDGKRRVRAGESNVWIKVTWQ